MIRRIAIYLLLIVFFFGALYVMSMIPSTMENKEAKIRDLMKQEELKRISVMQVNERPLVETIVIPGMVEAYKDVTLGAVIPGMVEKIHVEEGDFVKQGQELIQIDLRSRQTMLAEAHANHDLAKKTLERMRKLRERGDVTIQEYDEAMSTEAQAAASVQRWEIEFSLGRINAPIDGIIDRIDADEGEYMHEGAQLGRLLSLDKVKISVGVPEKYADSVSSQKEATVFIDGLNEKRTATLQRVAYGADTRTNTFEAILTLDNPGHRIRPGMIVRTTLVVRQEPNALMIPLLSLVKRAEGMVAFVEKDGVVMAKPVLVGAIDKDFVEIQEGISLNEKVVVIGQQELVNGQKVNVVEHIQQVEIADLKKEQK